MKQESGNMNKTKKIVIVFALVLALALSLSACGVKDQVEGAVENAARSAEELIGQFLSGDVTGEIGKDYRTEWFSFNIKSINSISDYAGYAPGEGNVLVDVVVTETNIFEEALPMGTFDFYLDDTSFVDYIYPISPLDDTMMPEEFELGIGETVEYHMIYEIPADAADLRLMYTEVDETEAEHTTFTIPVSL
jgi:hypothetical protein